MMIQVHILIGIFWMDGGWMFVFHLYAYVLRQYYDGTSGSCVGGWPVCT
jgi:hypothetical protein